MRNIIIFFFIVGLAYSGDALAQGTAEDYARSEAYKDLVANKVFNNPGTVHWMEKDSKFWYQKNTRKGDEYILVDALKGKKSPLFDQKKLAAALSKESGKSISVDSLKLRNVIYDGKHLDFSFSGKRWKADLKNYRISEGDTSNRFGGRNFRRGGYWGDRADDSRSVQVTSPDSNWVAYIKNHNVYVYPKGKQKEEVQLSFDGAPGNYYANSLQWSPDSKKLVATRVRPNVPRTLYLIESSPTDQLQPKLQTRNYLKPGDAMPQKQPVLFIPSEKKSFAVDPNLIPNQYALSAIRWHKDSRAFTFEYNQRGHQRYEVFSMDANTGKVKTLIDEVAKTFIDYSGKKYRADVNDGKEIIWASERDGWNHLYLYDGETGRVKNQITKGEWVVRKVIKVDDDSRTIIFEGSGKNPTQDPYFIQYYKVNFDGSNLVALTSEDGNHSAVFSPDYQYFVDTYSQVNMPPVKVLRNAADGKIIMEIERADISELEKTDWKKTEIFTAKGRDGITDIWGIIARPTNFDPNKKYPVIEYIYAGPQSSFVPKSFSTNPSRLNTLAELGFIVVQIDGMGTSNRSKAFHDVAWKNLKDAGFPDRILWMKKAAEKYPYMDISRVGIFGTSAGGQNAAGAVLFHPEFYKVAVAACGCHDNRMDKLWWNEQFMGYPIGKQYEECSNIENAWRLKGKLLLIVGELDDNVDPSSTFQFVYALIKAKKDHEFIMVPGMGHSNGGPYGTRKTQDFFVKNLLGVNPPVWEGQEDILNP